VDVSLAAINDAESEGDETISLTVAAGAGYDVGRPAAATATIKDDDVPAVAITAAANQVSEGPNPGSLVFTIARGAGSATAAAAAAKIYYSVAGTATPGADYQGLPNYDSPTRKGWVLLPADTPSVNVTLPVVGDTTYEGNETVQLTLAIGADYSVGLPDSASATIVEDDPPPVTVAVVDDTAAETTGSDTIRFRVTRAGDTTADLPVAYSLGGTSTAADYGSPTGFNPADQTGTVVIPAGQSSVDVYLTPLDDSLREGDETVRFTVVAGSGYAVGQSGEATATILDDDVPRVTLTAATSSAAEEQAGAYLEFLAQRVGDTTADLTVMYTVGGTAAAANDYAAFPGFDPATGTGTITIPAGQSSIVITISSVDDALPEGDETVVLTLTPGSEYSIGSPGAATGTIVDDDVVGAPVVTLSAPDPQASEPGLDTAAFQISRRGSQSDALVVWYTVSGTASQGVDYDSLPNFDVFTSKGMLVIPAGE
jgi:hypothetical protein